MIFFLITKNFRVVKLSLEAVVWKTCNIGCKFSIPHSGLKLYIYITIFPSVAELFILNQINKHRVFHIGCKCV